MVLSGCYKLDIIWGPGLPLHLYFPSLHPFQLSPLSDVFLTFPQPLVSLSLPRALPCWQVCQLCRVPLSPLSVGCSPFRQGDMGTAHTSFTGPPLTCTLQLPFPTLHLWFTASGEPQGGAQTPLPSWQIHAWAQLPPGLCVQEQELQQPYWVILTICQIFKLHLFRLKSF